MIEESVYIRLPVKFGTKVFEIRNGNIVVEKFCMELLPMWGTKVFSTGEKAQIALPYITKFEKFCEGVRFEAEDRTLLSFLEELQKIESDEEYDFKKFYFIRKDNDKHEI